MGNEVWVKVMFFTRVCHSVHVGSAFRGGLPLEGRGSAFEGFLPFEGEGSISRKPQHKDVYRRTIEMPQCARTFKVNCCVKVHNVLQKQLLPISG